MSFFFLGANYDPPFGQNKKHCYVLFTVHLLLFFFSGRCHELQKQTSQTETEKTVCETIAFVLQYHAALVFFLVLVFFVNFFCLFFVEW